MHIARERNVVIVLSIIGCVSVTALWWASATSHAALPASENPGAVSRKIAGNPSGPVVDDRSTLRASETYAKLPLGFEINQGQTDRQVKFLARGSGYSLFLTPTETVLSLKQTRLQAEAAKHDNSSRNVNDVLRMKLLGANPTPRIEGSGQLPGMSNYFIGKDPKKWLTSVPTFAKLHYREVYRGVDVVYYGKQGVLENDFVVAPGANPGLIALAFDGANKISVDDNGSLVLHIGTEHRGSVRFQKPVIYQTIAGERREVAGSYTIRNGHEVGFAIAAYDLSQPLIIDPLLVYSSYLGGNGADSGNAIIVDDLGNAYVTGDTGSTTFPAVSAIDPTRSGTSDAFVAKINPTGSALVYSTYLGGNGTDSGADIAVDAAGNAYLTGRTTSSDFPSVNAFDSVYSGGTDEDAFVTRINAAGSALLYSTYLSGTFGSRGWGIAASSSQGFAYVTGTTSTGFPVTNGAFENANFSSGFLAKLCTNCAGASSLVYSTFLAHTGFAEGRSVAADVAGNAYVTGNLNSTATNFATLGVVQTLFGGGSADAFVEKFNTNLSGSASRVFATYLGGNSKDIGGADGTTGSGRAIAIDATGNVYVTGSTNSPNFPLANASQNFNAGQNDVFLTKLNATASTLIYSTYLGGNNDDFGRSVAVNVGGSAYVTGVAGANFPTVAPLATPIPGVGFVTKFTPAGTPIYSTILSGVTNGSFSIALDGAGNAFATGSTNSTIVTVGPFQPVNGGGGTDGWVSVIADPTIIGRVSDENGNPLVGASVNLSGVPAATTTTDANGGYTFGLLNAGNNYTVSVVAPGFIFASATVNNLLKNARRDFGPAINSIVGQVKVGNTGLSGVTMTLSGGKSLVTQTDANGFYGFNNLPSGRDYVVTPSKLGFTFEPVSKEFDNLLVDQVFNFAATPVPILSFSAAAYSASEGAGSTTITVTRTNDTAGVSTVALALEAISQAPCNTFDGKARRTCDYTVASGLLTFNAGDTSKSFTILINDDVYVEGDETVTLSLSSPNGAVLGQPSSTTLTIVDNDSVPPTTNPLDNADQRFFVNQHYIDFLNRLPDQSGFDFWTAQITQCGTNQTCINNKRLDVSNAFFFELEYQQTAAYVFRLYRAAFGNNQPFPNPDPANPVEAHKLPSYDVFSQDRSSLIGSANLAQDQLALANLFVARPEFLNRYAAGLTLDQFVDAILAGIASDSGADLTSQRTGLIALGSRGAVMYRLADDNIQTNPINNRAFIDAEYNRSFVASEYFGYLRRDADINGFLFWLGQVNGAPLRDVARQHAMVCSFITSLEYQLRFSSVVTHSNTECQ